MAIFTWIGMIVVGALALAIVAALVLVLLSERVGRIHTAFRRYEVRYPDTSKDPHGPFQAYTNYWLWASRYCFSFRGAARAAKKVRGTRILDRWNLSYSVVRSGWSESANGYIDDRDPYGDYR